ncbi:class I SAM-dependent RNA methyltransferase [Streptomyces cavernicola]|uniref:RsmD family RNA methyltransferase n=1 Tax=Streptomyces cavernicola TaxID=3043613 RepID=A0ABT6SCU8_9ACTN|nr:RsmD family RNA methyltransferase [Streptomyces sp. B-S-A6]MDI3405634.1 RsmD family RNA methyltransferase [Streptomyces sp. B-S-A6]
MTRSPDPHPPAAHRSALDLRDELLGPSRNRKLTGAQVCAAARLVFGRAEGLSLYGISAPDMEAEGLTILGRTLIECCTDDSCAAVADALAELQDALPPAADAMVADLFCGSGNFGFHIGVRLGRPVFAAELDPDVHRATRHNFDVIGAAVELRRGDYRDLLRELPPRGPRDIYLVEPPWGPAVTAEGLDLLRTSPPVPEILDGIIRSRAGLSCLIAVKTTDLIARDSLAVAFKDATHLRTIHSGTALPRGPT